MRNFYNLGIRLYGFSILMAGFFNEKAKKWRSGRKNIFLKLTETIQASDQPLAWFHCASLGEFEQGRPVIEAFKNKFPSYKILLTFFSPSGYEARKDYKEADYVFYLPLDTPANAKKFLDIIKPQIAVFVKYEFWFNYLNELKNDTVPAFVISAKFRKDQYFFRRTGGWFRKQLHNYNTIFLQDEGSETLLKKFGINNVMVCGDTRFDRVINIAGQSFSDPLIEKFKNGEPLWICGSTWEEDEKLIFPIFQNLIRTGRKIKLLIIPHEVSEERIKSIESNYSMTLRYSEATDNNVYAANVIILDKIGLLSYLYRYGDIAYVGGGFGKGIHNLPEAAVYGIPVVFGPNYQKFIEAGELIKKGGGFSISSAGELETIIVKLLSDKNYREKCGASGTEYILSGNGATEKIISTFETIISGDHGGLLG
jgi:3-deoxy-D-manno-octulosonic-acid transferase